LFELKLTAKNYFCQLKFLDFTFSLFLYKTLGPFKRFRCSCTDRQT